MIHTRCNLPAKRIAGITAALATTALVSACAVGPDFEHPKAPDVSGYTHEPLTEHTASADIKGGESQRFVEGMDIPGEWWTLFKSPQLNALIEQSLKGNPDLQAAEAALRVTQENVKTQEGSFYPSVTGNYNAQRQKIAGSVSGTNPLSSPVPIFSLYTGQVAVSYTPDVLGLNRRTVESLEAQSESQRFQLEAAYISLTSNVVAAAVQEASLRAQIAATREMIDSNTRILDLQRNQLAKGSASRLDIAAQESQLAQVTATLPPLQKQLAVQRNLLTALAGKFPSEEISEKFTLDDLHLPQDLPVSLPSRLVDQRPDVRSAEEQLHSASAQVGVAIANRLPQFTIDATAGDTGTMFRHLFNPADAFWSLAGGITQPIFDGGTLLHRQRGAEAAYDHAAAQYRSTVIGAFQNVADTLRALQYDANALNAAAAAKDAASTTLDLTRRQLQSGSANYLAVLSAEQTYQQAVISLVQAQANRYADTAALFQALGGGWWNKPDIVADDSNDDSEAQPSKQGDSL